MFPLSSQHRSLASSSSESSFIPPAVYFDQFPNRRCSSPAVRRQKLVMVKHIVMVKDMGQT
eukprot:3064384-Rhodomonas_salina.1